jgi:hypothetical protein
MKRHLFPLSVIGLAMMVAVLNVSADSTITIPVPDKAVSNKEITLSLRIPPNTEPLTQEKRKKLQSRSSTIVWNANPAPKLPIADELYVVFDKFHGKGWIKGHSAKSSLVTRPITRYTAIRILEHIIDNILDFAAAPNLTRVIRKSNLVSTDIDDLRRMGARYNKELLMYGKNMKKVDKDLLMLQEQLKKAKSGILRVIKVEGVHDGSTIIHLNVD